MSTSTEIGATKLLLVLKVRGMLESLGFRVYGLGIGLRVKGLRNHMLMKPSATVAIGILAIMRITEPSMSRPL